jgi:hypothetical protein
MAAAAMTPCRLARAVIRFSFPSVSFMKTL